jgi:hypothetical protein
MLSEANPTWTKKLECKQFSLSIQNKMMHWMTQADRRFLIAD